MEREVHQLLGVKSVSWGGGRGWKEPHEVDREVHQLLGVKSVSCGGGEDGKNRTK